jgi:hypothetical protein
VEAGREFLLLVFLLYPILVSVCCCYNRTRSYCSSWAAEEHGVRAASHSSALEDMRPGSDMHIDSGEEEQAGIARKGTDIATWQTFLLRSRAPIPSSRSLRTDYRPALAYHYCYAKCSPKGSRDGLTSVYRTMESR